MGVAVKLDTIEILSRCKTVLSALVQFANLIFRPELEERFPCGSVVLIRSKVRLGLKLTRSGLMPRV